MRLLSLVLFIVAAPVALAQASLFTPAPGEADRRSGTGDALSPRQDQILSLLKAELGVEAVEIVTADVDRLMDAPALHLAFPGRTFEIETVATTRRPNGLDSWVGQSDGDASSPGADVLAALVTRDGMVTGSVRRGGYLYEVRPLTGGLHAVARKSMAGYSLHGDGYAAFEAAQAERIEQQRQIDALQQDRPRALDGGGASDAQARGGTVIDVLMPYTTNVTAAYADPAALAQSFIDYSNQVYVNSGVAVVLALVATYETPFASTGDLITDLDDLTDDGDGVMDEAHAYRDAYGADLVALLAGTNTSGTCGVGWVDASAAFGFSTNSGGCGAETLTHEIGHNFGAQHDATTGGYAPYSYGRGYVNDVGKWGTIMAYESACTGQFCETVPYLSNPAVSYDDTTAPEQDGPTGDATSADNARVHNERAATLEAFRATSAGPAVFASSPASIAVSAVPDGSATATGTLFNTAGAGSQDLTWAATFENVTGGDGAGACTNGQELVLAGTPGGYPITAGSSERGQSFVAPCTGLLASLSPTFFALGSEWTGVYRLYEGEGTGGTELASVAVSETTPPSVTYTVTGGFVSPPEVTAGATYTWFLDLTTGSGYQQRTEDPYDDGTAYHSTSGDPTASSASEFDLAFTATFLAPETWVGAVPRVGTIAPGASADVTLSFDATGLAEGTYTADLVLTPNAFAGPTATMPVTLTVADGLTGADGWRVLALPGAGTYDDLMGPWWTQGFTGSDAPGGDCNVYGYDESQGSFTAGWTCLSDQAAAWAAGAGVMAYVFADDDGAMPGVQGGFPKPLVYAGAAGTAPHTFSGLSRSAGTPGEVGWHLLGNPLATAFDWDLVTFPGSMLELAVHVYDPTFNTTGDYRTYVQGTGGDLTDGWVPAFQGFFVQANADGASLEIPAAAVPGGDPGVYGRTAEAPTPLRLQLSIVDDGTESPVSTAYVASADDAQIGPDRRDAARLPAVRLPSAALLTGRPGDEAPTLVFNTLPSAVGDLELPMAVSLEGHAPGSLALSIAWTGRLPNGWAATLLDRYADVAVVLEEGGRYAFDVTVSEADADATASDRPFAIGQFEAARLAAGGPVNTGDRFALQLTSAAVGIGDQAAVAFELFPPVPNPAQGLVRLRYSLDVAGPARLVVYDALGRQVALVVDGDAGVGTRSVMLDASRLAPGVYVARLDGPSGTLTQRLTVVR